MQRFVHHQTQFEPDVLCHRQQYTLVPLRRQTSKIHYKIHLMIMTTAKIRMRKIRAKLLSV